jgi:hypothetical protein
MRHKENWIIAEAVMADFFVCYETFECSFCLDQDRFGACQAEAADESCGPLFWRDVFEKLQNLCDIPMVDEGSVGLCGEGILPLRVAGILPAIRGNNALESKDRGQDGLATQGRDALATPGSTHWTDEGLLFYNGPRRTGP